MNYYAARRRACDHRWDYTVMNDGKIVALGYCAQSGGGHHGTEQEAQECYRRWLLDHDLELQKAFTSAHKCRGQLADGSECGKWTPNAAEVGHRLFFLCDEHRTREEVERLFPPGSVGTSASSW